ncbi:MAG: leucine-rich repeat protein [Christensenellales bacterium]|jgi:uncharacterized repeat protein (TIGR02543 family)|nr:leucine-rich repeat protein [Clostridiales bacterium]
MNRYLRLIVIIVFILTAAGLLISCEGGPMLVSIEVDPDTISEEYDVSEFELSSIMLILTYENEETETIPLQRTMIKAEDKAKLSVSGDHTITVTYKQRTTTFILKLREGISGLYKVIFKDENGNQLGETQYIEPGGTALAPEVPDKPEYAFNGWIDQRGVYSFFDNIYEDKVFTATYTPDFYVITFIRPNGSLIAEVKIKKGESAEPYAPNIPTQPGLKAIGWNRSLDDITADTTITAVYVPENITVTFVYGNDFRPPTVASFAANTDIEAPVNPHVPHAEFVGWYTNEKFEGEMVEFPYLLQNEITFYAKYISRTEGSPGLEYSLTGNNTYTISGYNGQDDVIVIPEKHNNLDVVGVDRQAFENAMNSRFYVTDTNNYFSTSDGVLFDITKERLIAYPSGRQINTYDVLESVKYIEDYAFANSKNLVQLRLPDEKNLLSIGDYAFYNCLRLTQINIPITVETIGNFAFYMEEDNALESLTFTLNSNLQQIGQGAFKGLNRLKQITLPSSRLENIGSGVFEGCQMLETIDIEEGSSAKFTSEGGALFNISKTTLIAYPANNIINERAFYIVPNTVEIIESGAFSESNIVGIRLSESIKEIRSYAFNSPKLQYIQFMGELPETIEASPFGDYNPSYIIIPEGVDQFDEYFSDYQIIIGQPNQTYGYHSATSYLYTIDDDEKLIVWGVRRYTDTVTIPAVIGDYQVKAIGSYAFYNNLTIANLTISEGIEIIDDFAFSRSQRLASVILPKSLTKIGDNAFAECSSLSQILGTDNVDIEDMEIDLVILGKEIFIETPWYDSEEKEFLMIGNSLIKYNGKGLRAVIPQNTKIIADNAFIDKSNLRNVVLSDDLQIISDYAFFGCSGLFFIEIPAKVNYIGYKAFYNCNSLYRIIMKSDTPPQLAFTEDIFTVNAKYKYGFIEDVDSDIYQENIYEFGILVPYTIDRAVLNVYENHPAWQGYNIFHLNMRKITFSSAGTQQISVDADTIYEPADPDPRPGYVFAGWYRNDSIDYQRENDPIIFPIDLEEDIPFFARWLNEDEGTQGLQYDLINDGTEYGVSGYYGDLRYVVVPNAYNDKPVTAILEGAFSSSINPTNSEVYEILLPNTITTIERGALEDTLWYSQFRGDFVFINDILIEYRGMDRNVVIPENIRYITANAFKDNNFIKTIEFSPDIQTLPYQTAYNCINLESIALPENLIEIKEMAFMGCVSLENIVFPESLETVAPNAFENTKWLYNYIDDVVIINDILYKYKGKQQTLHIPNIIKKIGKEAFFENTNLRDVYIPQSVEFIGESAFEGCSSLEYLQIEDNSQLKKIENRAFYGCSIMEDFIMGANSKIEHIGDFAFAYCSLLMYVNFPSTLTYLGEGAYFDSGVAFAKFASGCRLSSIEKETFSNCRNLKTVSFGEGTMLSIIKESAFENCKNLISVIIPESNSLLIEILQRAFNNCTSLINVTLPSSLMDIGDDAFTDTQYLKSDSKEHVTIGSVLMKYNGTDSIVHISSEIAAISKGAFKGNTHIREIVMAQGSKLFAIGEEAFMDCVNLESVNFPSTITYVGKDAMLNTAWMNKYVDDYVVINDILIKYKGDDYQAIVPNTVSVIGIEAFANNTKLRNIEIGNSVTSIMERAFNGMSGQSSITMLRSAPPMLALDNDIPGTVYVETNAVFNNYREDSSWVRFVNDPAVSIMVKYEITFKLMKEGASMEFLSIETNALYTEPIPVCEGYTFVGWYKNYDAHAGEYTDLITMPFIPESDITLYAQWIDNSTGTIYNVVVNEDIQPVGGEEGTYIVEYRGFDRHVMIPSIFSDKNIIGIAKYNDGSRELKAFSDNEHIEEITFVEGYDDGEQFVEGSTIRFILEGAFENAINLKRIVLPSSLEYIGPNAFRNCVNLEEVIFTSSSTPVVIAENAFYSCSALKSITFEENIYAIGENAFGGCDELTTIYMNGDEPPQVNQPFEINEGLKIYVNRSVDDLIVEKYKNEWPLYEDYIYPKPLS